MADIKTFIREFAIHDDQKSFGKFFNHFYPKLLRFALFTVKSETLAEEVVSDVFVKIWERRKRVIEIDNIDFYLFTSVRNQSLTYLKRNKHVILPLEQVSEFTLISKSHPENELLDKELILKVEEAIQKLPSKCQMIFRLSRDDGFKYEEVAKILNISKSTVKNQMTIALKKIKEDLSTYFDEATDQKYKFLLSISLSL